MAGEAVVVMSKVSWSGMGGKGNTAVTYGSWFLVVGSWLFEANKEKTRGGWV